MKIYEIYPRMSNGITMQDLEDLKEPLKISSVEITGDTKKTVWLNFESTTLKYKCSKKDVFNLAKEFNVSDTDAFNDRTVKISAIDEKVVIQAVIEKKK